jgi:hypothetical protein
VTSQEGPGAALGPPDPSEPVNTAPESVYKAVPARGVRTGSHLVEHASCSVHGPITQGRHKNLTLAVEAHMKDHPPSTPDQLVKVTQWSVPTQEAP